MHACTHPTYVQLVPQGMAYAVLSSLPPIYGLYASTIVSCPLMFFGAGSLNDRVTHKLTAPQPSWRPQAGYVYTLFGTSGQLTIGPVALVSLFMSTTYNTLGIPLTTKDKDPVLNAQAQYHTYVRCEIAAVVSFAAAVRRWNADAKLGKSGFI